MPLHQISYVAVNFYVEFDPTRFTRPVFSHFFKLEKPRTINKIYRLEKLTAGSCNDTKQLNAV